MQAMTGRTVRATMVVSFALWLFGLAGADFGSAQDSNATRPAQETAGYTVRFQGVEDDLLELLRQVSVAVDKSAEAYVSTGIIARRIREDKELFKTALTSRGYMASSVDASLDTESRPPVLTYVVDTGAPFMLSGISYEVADDYESNATMPTAEELGLKVGARFNAVPVVGASGKVRTWLSRRGYPFPEVSKPRVLADFEEHSARAVYTVTPGPKADFGETTIEGLETVDEEYVRAYIPWREGQTFDRQQFETYYNELAEQNLFSTIRIDPVQEMDQQGRVPIKVELKERKHRTVRAGLGYSTDKGPQARVGWEHRNLLGGGEKLETKLRVSAVESDATVQFTNPRFLNKELTFAIDASFVKSDTKAYKAETFETGFLVQKEVIDHLQLGFGPRYRRGDILEDESRPFDNNRAFDLVSLLFKAVWDDRDSVLDPTSGNKVELRVEPFFGVGDSDSDSPFFVQTELSATNYLLLLESPRLVLAGRAAAGASWGTTRDELPAVLRFYPGGGGSVRGYGYQKAGPVTGDTPLGGAAYAEFSAEARAMVTEKFGIVPFIDGGYAFADPLDPQGEMLFGAGLGVRYHTSFGPLRADVAVPLNRREGVDDPVQFYISIGQAF
ncbi:MAG: autotransporter assembly complex protein TamA [Oceanidesulfovibrio sp.]